ncbi:hypothetical protein NC651_040365 [Populus alba x Populus x berolinensis]|nr:hypothetical protein NC651_040365 [Populus alba x Populus x berolinensis]
MEHLGLMWNVKRCIMSCLTFWRSTGIQSFEICHQNLGTLELVSNQPFVMSLRLAPSPWSQETSENVSCGKQNMLPWKRNIALDSNSFVGKYGKYYRRYSLLLMKILPY